MVKGDDGSLYMANRDGFDSHTDVVAMPFSRCTSEHCSEQDSKLESKNLFSQLDT